MTQQPRTPTTERRACQCCGQAVTVYSADEGTQSYVGVERADLLAQIEKAVLGLPDFRDSDDMPWPWISRAAVLAAIRSAAPVEPT